MSPDIEPTPKKRDADMNPTELSAKRTGLSEHRTNLSEHRTALSDLRTDLSKSRSHLSNERTHLSYIRTGISLISLGITMNRFAWFLIENKSLSRYGGRTFLHDAKNVGIGMVVLGCAMVIWSLFRFEHAFRDINSGVFRPSHRSIYTFTLGLILIGTVSIIWLMVG